jgi:NitT/TauT family transport system substrate-binding protein
VSKTTAMKGLGQFDLNFLQKGAATFRALGLIKNKIDISKVVKSDLIPK